jgi:hypothetical protein
MLLLSVLVIAIVAAGYGLAATFADDMDDLGRAAGEVYTTGAIGR